MRIRNELLSIIVIVLGLTGCPDNQGRQAEKNSYQNVSVGQFVEMNANKDFILINTHIPYEGEIPGTEPFDPIQ